jgi:hypothetical protein
MFALSSEIVLAILFLNIHGGIISQKEVGCQAPDFQRELREVKAKGVSRRCYSI